MTQPSYDLLREPWISVVRADGSFDTLGLREVLFQAHKLRAVSGETSVVTAAIYRLLLAVLYAALGMPNSDAWEDIWAQGRFPADRLEAYLNRWSDRFNLFHPERPFFQWFDDRVHTKSIINLVLHMASGNNATLFDHHHEGQDVALAPAEAARSLLAEQAFGLGGLSGLPQKFTDAPWARGVIFLAEGMTLFETLMFNYLPERHWSTVPFSNPEVDRAFWEADNPLIPERNRPLGVKDYLTWPNRLIWLFPELDPDGRWRIRQVTRAPGLTLTKDSLRDPYKHYRMSRQSGYTELRFQEDRALWRDSVSLLQLQTDDHWPPRPVAWLSDLSTGELLPGEARLRLTALGMATDQSKIDFFREEHFPLPQDYLREPKRVNDLSLALSLAEQVGEKLGQALYRLATLLLSPGAEDPNGRRPERNEVNNLVGHWGALRSYWSALEVPFHQLVVDLPARGREALESWRAEVERVARHAFDQAIHSLGETPRVLKAATRAEVQLRGALRCVFHPEDERCKERASRRKGARSRRRSTS
ncbi:MAG: type I-E CRISPR-associated protein Cse1/CasA [Clostridiales bacterium]|nr:type I-E CRISPR-associated protein Cse1/CasA [Clostridiales bacterium]